MTRSSKGLIGAFAVSVAFGGMAVAGPDDDNLVVNDELQLITETAAPEHMEYIDTIYSGWRFRTDETQALQLDDFDNPGMLTVDKAIDAYSTVEGAAGESCASCHGDVESFKGLHVAMPKVAENGQLVVMEDLINTCRTERMQADAWKWSGQDMQGMVALIGHQSRGMPMNVPIDGAAAPFWEQGKELYYTKVGQLQMACSNCHEDNYGVMIRADHLSQGQINGFPTYRLKNAKMNSSHGRFKGCMKNIRATPYKEGGDEFKALELYLASRGQGLSVETPSVRN